ncbi:hypothetical protein BOTCAL_0072g00350 [Botryotinia calthae]|uniref:Transcription initiation factor TFIID subunit 1 histone acetyltransferase domain-containing protein n=1 Tax=Botryotinia calthae TaxID=38488 RepID=A0A4Y8D8R9_9HELO|nr:hypothetical protein BOTCAL_0072g00350 [Botryotinia calthae]
MAESESEPKEFTQFTEIDWKRQDEQDAKALESVLRASGENGEINFGDEPLDLGEKADDAQDFEDISDDDLPEEEEASLPSAVDLPALTDDAGTNHDTDDLFGEGRDSSPFGFDEHIEIQDGESQAAETTVEELPDAPAEEEDLLELNFPGYNQARLNNQDLSIPAPAESESDLAKQLFPSLEPGVILNFNELLPPKLAHFVPKVPLKQPKPLNPTKVSLDLAPDQEKSFRSNIGTATGDKRKRAAEAEAKGLVAIIEESADEAENEETFDFEEPAEDEKLGGVTWADLQMICDDWDSKINAIPIEAKCAQDIQDTQDTQDEWLNFAYSGKKPPKTKTEEKNYFNTPQFAVPSFDNLQKAAAISAKRPFLDLNDSNLLIEELKFTSVANKRQRLGGNFRGGNNIISTKLRERFNISNDEAYDALKENHQSKVRAAIGNLTVEHSLPALRLQWPYYKVKLYTKEARALHRPTLRFNKWLNQPVTFDKPGMRKKKEARTMSIAEVFKESKDLTLGDFYSTATLIEYSEEQPIVLSNFGMGNKIINYYRRKDAEDQDRPSPEDKIGDTTILLPEDKSPFANFGFVDPGETVRALHNEMYRAPIFKHQPQNTDFLCVRSTTGVHGTTWHLRNIDNLFVAGQQFPSIKVPTPHSRTVTNATKNRVKMIAFRKIRRSNTKSLRIAELTAHIPDTNDMQNRAKLKEILVYDKNEKVWRPEEGTIIPDEAALRSLVKPEDCCMIDAMHVGCRNLADAGLSELTEKEEGDEAFVDRPIDFKLTPWNTSKAFLDATSGKAMLELHGDGDPSGCGLAISMIQTSMKGGYIGAVQGPNATSAAAIAAERKANGGHTYNVKKQEELYNNAIRDIWEKQKTTLSDTNEHISNELEEVDEDERFRAAPTPHSTTTPAAADDNYSQVSRVSNTDNPSGKFMRITRKVKVGNYGQTEERVETVRDMRVWKEYIKRKKVLAAANSDVYAITPSGDADLDRATQMQVQKELDRLERNKDRRHAREKQKTKQSMASQQLLNPGSPGPSGTPVSSIEKPTGTTRKCANCGQTGHIKTNKKLCPLLNGTMKPEDGVPNHGGFGAIQAPPAFG